MYFQNIWTCGMSAQRAEMSGGGEVGLRGRCSLTAGGYTHIPCSNHQEICLVNVDQCFFSIHFIVFYEFITQSIWNTSICTRAGETPITGLHVSHGWRNSMNFWHADLWLVCPLALVLVPQAQMVPKYIELNISEFPHTQDFHNHPQFFSLIFV